MISLAPPSGERGTLGANLLTPGPLLHKCVEEREIDEVVERCDAPKRMSFERSEHSRQPCYSRIELFAGRRKFGREE